MTRNPWAAAQARWQGWAVLGVLITIAILAHDLGMAGVAARGELRFVPGAATVSTHHVVHVDADTVASHDLSSFHHHDVPGDPLQSHCAIARAAIPTANDTLDSTLQTILGSIIPIVGWHDGFRPPRTVDVTSRSSRDQRTSFQVFLI